MADIARRQPYITRRKAYIIKNPAEPSNEGRQGIVLSTLFFDDMHKIRLG